MANMQAALPALAQYWPSRLRLLYVWWPGVQPTSSGRAVLISSRVIFLDKYSSGVNRRDFDLGTLCHTRSCDAETVWKNTCDCRRSQRCNTFTGLLLVPSPSSNRAGTSSPRSWSAVALAVGHQILSASVTEAIQNPTQTTALLSCWPCFVCSVLCRTLLSLTLLLTNGLR